MKKPFLIQRAKFQQREGKTGIDAMLKFEYMGSAEFEFGALPESLKRIREKISEYEGIYYVFNDNPSKVVRMFYKTAEREAVSKILEGLGKNEYHLKEYCNLSDFLNDVEIRTDFWWDIENDFMFWKGNEFTSERDALIENAIKGK